MAPLEHQSGLQRTIRAQMHHLTPTSSTRAEHESAAAVKGHKNATTPISSLCCIPPPRPYGDSPTGRSGSDLASASQTIHPRSSERQTQCAGISAATCLVEASRPYRSSEAPPHASDVRLMPGCDRRCCLAELRGLRLVFIVWRTEKRPRSPSAGGMGNCSSDRSA